MIENKIIHIGLVGPLPPPYGGMANQANQLYSLLKNDGFQVSFVQTNAPYHFRFIKQVKGVRAFFRLIPYLIKLWRLAGQADVIHVFANSGWSWQLYAAPAIWLAYFRKTPVVINYRGGEAADYFKKSIFWVAPSMRKATRIVVPSIFLNKVFRDFGFESTVIPNIINLERFAPAENHIKDKANPHLIITRNLEAIYGIDMAIMAFASVSKIKPEVKLSIAGSGPQLFELQRLVSDMKLQQKITFTGKLNPEQIAALYQSADIMLNPTTVDNMPNSILEAMASGVAIVTTEVGGIPYLVKNNETALMTEVNNPEMMASQILKLLESKDLQQRLIRNGIKEVKKYAWPEVRKQWVGLYQDLSENR